MSRRDLTEGDVRTLVRGLAANGNRVEAEKVQRLWDEVKRLRDQESVSAQLHNIEGEY